MTRFLFASLLLALAVPAGAADRRVTVTDFDRIVVDGPFEVTLVTGKPSSAVISGDARALDRVSIDVEGRLLKVRPNRSARAGDSGPVRIALSTHYLRGASVIGSGSISIDKARHMRFDISVAGSGRIALGKVETDILTLGLLGSGRIEVAGKTRTLRATIRGSGDLDAAELMAEDAQIQADTAGNIGVGVRRAAKINATGQGHTLISGTPACIVEARGTGLVTCGKN